MLFAIALSVGIPTLLAGSALVIGACYYTFHPEKIEKLPRRMRPFVTKHLCFDLDTE